MAATALAAAPSAQAATTYSWKGIRDYDPIYLDGGRSLHVRLALRVTHVNNVPTTIRSYTAWTCTVRGYRYPCSFDYNQWLYQSGSDIDSVSGRVSTTGDDGFASVYGREKTISGCSTYRARSHAYNFGLAGKAWGEVGAYKSGSWNKCA